MDIITTILLGTVKFGMTFPLAIMKFQFSFFETILWINVGGLIGIYFFAFLSEKTIKLFNKIFRKNKKQDPKNKKIFSKKNRRIVHIKQKYGLIGIAATTPILFSIPVGTFLVTRYYPRVRSRLLFLIGSNIIWSFFYTAFYMFWNDLLIK